MQSFKNYIPFNIPITDIFVNAFEGDSLFFVDTMELAYPDESIFFTDPKRIVDEERKEQLKEQIRLSELYQFKMKTYVDKATP